MPIKLTTYYLSQDANGSIYVSNRKLNSKYYCTIAKLKCCATKSKRVTKKGVYPGAVCITTMGEILKIKEVQSLGGFSRSWIKDGIL